MKEIERRIEKIQLQIDTHQPGCAMSILIVIPEDARDKPFDTSSYAPSDEAIKEAISALRQSGKCQGCRGTCAQDWSPAGFTNHTLAFGGPPIIYYCSDPEMPVFMRQMVKKGGNTND
jgi:hypothetical protein